MMVNILDDDKQLLQGKVKLAITNLGENQAFWGNPNGPLVQTVPRHRPKQESSNEKP